MPSKKFETSYLSADGHLSVKAPLPSLGRASLRTLLINLWIPLVLLALIPLGHYVEDPNRVNPYLLHIALLVGINITLALSLQLINGISGQFSLGHAGFMALGAYLAGYATSTYGKVEAADQTLDFANPGPVLAYFIALIVTLLLAACLLYAVFLAIGMTRKLHHSVPGILMLVVGLWVAVDIAVASSDTTLPSFLIWSQIINLLMKIFAGLLKSGPVLASLFNHFSIEHRPSVTFLIALLGGGSIAAIAGLIVGLPTLRLRGDYLAIATLGFAEIIRIAIVNENSLGGATGMSLPTFHAENDDSIPIRFIFPWIYGAAFLTFMFIWRLTHSPKGRALAAVREDEIAAAAVGINTTRQKVMSFVIGAFFAGIAGALYAHLDGYLNTNSFGFMRSVEIVVMVTLGGLGSLWGAVIAAIALTLLPEVLRSADQFMPQRLARGAKWTAENRMVIYAAALIVIMLLRSTWRDLLQRARQLLPATSET